MTMKPREQDGFIPEREEFDLYAMRFLRRPGSYMTMGPDGPREVVMWEHWRWSPSVEAYVYGATIWMRTAAAI